MSGSAPPVQVGQLYCCANPFAVMRVEGEDLASYRLEFLLNIDTVAILELMIDPEDRTFRYCYCPTVRELPPDINVAIREWRVANSIAGIDAYPEYHPGDVLSSGADLFFILASSDPTRNFLVSEAPLRCYTKESLVQLLASDLFHLHSFPPDQVSTRLSPEELMMAVPTRVPWVHPADAPEPLTPIWETLSEDSE